MVDIKAILHSKTGFSLRESQVKAYKLEAELRLFIYAEQMLLIDRVMEQPSENRKAALDFLIKSIKRNNEK